MIDEIIMLKQIENLYERYEGEDIPEEEMEKILESIFNSYGEEFKDSKVFEQFKAKLGGIAKSCKLCLKQGFSKGLLSSYEFVQRGDVTKNSITFNGSNPMFRYEVNPEEDLQAEMLRQMETGEQKPIYSDTYIEERFVETVPEGVRGKTFFLAKRIEIQNPKCILSNNVNANENRVIISIKVSEGKYNQIQLLQNRMTGKYDYVAGCHNVEDTSEQVLIDFQTYANNAQRKIFTDEMVEETIKQIGEKGDISTMDSEAYGGEGRGEI